MLLGAVMSTSRIQKYCGLAVGAVFGAWWVFVRRDCEKIEMELGARFVDLVLMVECISSRDKKCNEMKRARESNWKMDGRLS